MKNIKLTLTIMCLITVMSNRTLKAEDKVNIGASADILSKYVWRGQNLVDDWVLQPGAYVSYKDITTLFWGNLDLTDENGYQGQFSEIDLTLDYSSQVPGIDFLGYSLGFIHYDFPIKGGADDTWEIYWGFGLDVPASPAVTVYHDVDEVPGTYVSFGVGHSFENAIELGPDTGLGVDLGASIGWGSNGYNKSYWTVDKSALNDLVLSATLPFEIAGFVVTPRANYITLLSNDIREPNAYGKNDIWVVGVGFAKEF
jgi:hypothetical protein